jgi:LCP family protein required for cell wall assembly
MRQAKRPPQQVLNPTLIWVLTAALLLGGCSGFIGALLPSRASALPLVTADPNATATATPFSPQSPTETPLPTATSQPTPTSSPTPAYPWGAFAGPAEPSAIEIPPPMPLVQQSPGTVNIILLGSDQRPNEGGHRTDTMMIVSLDPQKGIVTMLSIPRDLYVYIPGWRIDRINTADAEGGPDLVAQTILYNFGIPIDHWARVNFGGFQQAIDLLGGIDVQSTAYLADECGRIHWRYGVGTYHMNGFAAMCYVRMRKTSSDFDRLRREQEVIRAIFNKALSLYGLSRLPDLYNHFSGMIQTDIQLDTLVPLVPLAATISQDTSRVHQFSVDQKCVTAWVVPYSGAQVLLPNRDAIQALLAKAFGP